MHFQVRVLSGILIRGRILFDQEVVGGMTVGTGRRIFGVALVVSPSCLLYIV